MSKTKAIEMLNKLMTGPAQSYYRVHRTELEVIIDELESDQCQCSVIKNEIKGLK